MFFFKKLKLIFYKYFFLIFILPYSYCDAETNPKKFNACEFGKYQSPINIKTENTNKISSSLKFYSVNKSSNILNNGNTIQINYKKGNKLFVKDMSYNLTQIHFHYPSEHEINEKKSDMEIHLVYKNTNENLAVVAIMVNKGKKNKLLSDLFNNFPLSENKNQTLKKIAINPINFLPQDRNYYKYMGSLTTPPCSENVTWYILKNRIEISSNQLKNYTKIFKMNARPPQALNNRAVEEKL